MLDEYAFTLHFATINTVSRGAPICYAFTFTLHFATINTMGSLHLRKTKK